MTRGGVPARIRTVTGPFLRRLPLPVGLRRQMFQGRNLGETKFCPGSGMVLRARLELAHDRDLGAVPLPDWDTEAWCGLRDSHPRHRVGNAASWLLNEVRMEQSARGFTCISRVELERLELDDDCMSIGGSAENRTQTDCLRDSCSNLRATEPS